MAVAHVWVVGESLRPSGEIPDTVDYLAREEGHAESMKVKPFVWGATNCTVIQIEAIKIDVGRHTRGCPKNATTALFRRSRSQPPKRAGGVNKCIPQQCLACQ